MVLSEIPLLEAAFDELSNGRLLRFGLLRFGRVAAKLDKIDATDPITVVFAQHNVYPLLEGRRS